MVDLLIRLYIPGKRVELQSQFQYCCWHQKFSIYLLTWLLSRQFRGFHFLDFVVLYYPHFNLFSYGEGNEKKKGIKNGKKKGKKSITHRILQRRRVDISHLIYSEKHYIFTLFVVSMFISISNLSLLIIICFFYTKK